MRMLSAVAAMLVLVSCSGSDAGADIPEQDPKLVEVGRTLYSANCAECHGEDLRGTDRGPSHLSRVYEPGHHGDGAFLVAVRSGTAQHHWNFGYMPPIEGLSDEDVQAIVAFVRERQQSEGFEPYPP